MERDLETLRSTPITAVVDAKTSWIRKAAKEHRKGFLGTSFIGLVVIGSTVRTLSDPSSEGIRDDMANQNTSGVVREVVLNWFQHPWRVATGLLTDNDEQRARDALDVGQNQTPSAANETPSTVAGLNPQSDPSLTPEPTLAPAPVDSGTLTNYTLTQTNGIWRATREVCGIPDGVENSRVKAIFKAAGFTGTETVPANTSLTMDCNIQG